MARDELPRENTGLGNYFVANYPPFSAWKPELVPKALEALNRPSQPGTVLGLYLHIPFCRQRCKFCYFRVYTDKNARDLEIYLDSLVQEVELYSRLPIVGGRSLDFVYFGGGTPSYLSAGQLLKLGQRLQALLPWDHAREITFECEPGTLQQHKLETLKQMGVTRLSIGVENFDDRILEANGRAHHSAEIFKAYHWARLLNFDQINIDLIAGMLGETWENWRDCIRKTIDLAPDCVTIYQLELPFNTVFSRELQNQACGGLALPTIADWPTKRAWVDYAFEKLGLAGYQVSSAYTMVRDRQRCRFVYRDSLWHGADMLGAGVASFGHANGIHMQNLDSWGPYVGKLLREGDIPLGRAWPTTPRQQLIREMVLQLKTGWLETAYFHSKFGVDILLEFADGFDKLAREEMARVHASQVELTRKGLLQVDRLLPTFFETEFHRPAASDE